MDATNIIYTGVATSTVPIEPNQNLQTILQNIDTAINDHNTAPDYTGYSLACVKQTDGITHPTNTQNFAEGISKILCDFKTAYTTFTGTTYVTNQGVITSAITGLQAPALTYVPFGITSADSIQVVWSKVFTGLNTAGLNTLTSTVDPYTANWGTLSITPSHSVITTWNNVITYVNALNTAIGTKQASIGTFNNSANCLSGGATDSVGTTINLLRTYICTLPTFDVGSVTWGCVSAGADLDATIDNIIAEVSTLATNYVSTAGTGLAATAVSACNGYSLAIDPTWTGLYKVMLSTGDTTANAGYLDSKISSNGGTLTITTSSHKVNLEVTTPMDNKVKVTSSGTADYLANKIPSTIGDWGISLITSVEADQLILTPQVQYPGVMCQTLMTYIQSDPDLLTQFANLISTSQNVPGLGITDLSIALTAGHFIYTWTPQSGVSQQAKWRWRSNVIWSTNYLTPANPLSAVDATTDVPSSATGANIPLQFQVDTVYPSGLIGSNIYESIKYTCQADTHGHTAGVINISQPALPGIDIIEYRLILNAGSVLQETIIATGLTPAVTFASVAAGTYHVEWRYGTSINGTILYSNDAQQLNAMCASSNIVIT